MAKNKCIKCGTDIGRGRLLIAGYCKSCANILIPILVDALNGMIIYYGGMAESYVEPEALEGLERAKAAIEHRKILVKVADNLALEEM